jgi:predicted O-methyltransferase YrrM
MKLPWVPRRPGPASGPPISSSLTDPEAAVLRRLARGCEVLEVGSAYGYSTVVMGSAARRLVTVDHHRHLNSLDALRRNLESYHLTDHVWVLVGEAAEVLPLLPAGSFDGAFVDGDHSREGVLADARNAVRLVRPGGWIAFHDWDEDTCPEVRPALREFFGNAVGGELTDTLFVVRRPPTEGRTP